MTEEQKVILRELKKSKMKKVYCLETNTVYDSIAEASRVTGLRVGNIHGVCEGKRKQTGGYHFEYADTATSNYTPIFM